MKKNTPESKLDLKIGDTVSFPVLSSRDGLGQHLIPTIMPPKPQLIGEGQIISIESKKNIAESNILTLTPMNVGWSPKKYPEHLAEVAPHVELPELQGRQHNLAFIKQKMIIEKIRRGG